MATQKIIIKKLEVGELHRVGNSLNWEYYLDADGYAHFVGARARGDDFVLHPDENDPDHPLVKAGDRVWVRCEGPYTKWGILTPPRNPARRVFWEAGVYVPREKFVFGQTDAQMEAKWRELRDFDESWMPGWHHRQVRAVLGESGLMALVELYLEDRGSISPWKVESGVWFHRDADLVECSKKILEFMKRY